MTFYGKALVFISRIDKLHELELKAYTTSSFVSLISSLCHADFGPVALRSTKGEISQ